MTSINLYSKFPTFEQSTLQRTFARANFANAWTRRRRKSWVRSWGRRNL